MGERRRLRVAIAGGSGLIGTALAGELKSRGDDVRVLTRSQGSAPHAVHWNPSAPDPALFEDLDAVVNLAGATLARRWSPHVRREILDSRIGLTQRLVAAIRRTARPPRALVSASAIGWYGNRGEETLYESSAPGTGFLAELASAWENEAAGASGAGVRVVTPRIGLVLSARGGVLARLAPIFRLGLGGPLASGRMWWSWIALEDLVGVFARSIDDAALAGPVNAVSPSPVRMRDFALHLAHVLGRPAWLNVPASALRVAYGTMADEVLLAGQRVIPKRLLDLDYAYRDAELGPALRRALASRG
jgi:uncharacterized protein